MSTALLPMVVASAPAFCDVCAGRRRAGLLGPGGLQLPMWCPHCTPGGPDGDAKPMPILSVPFRADTPVRSTP